MVFAYYPLAILEFKASPSLSMKETRRLFLTLNRAASTESALFILL
jgi:hypothetical protein